MNEWHLKPAITHLVMAELTFTIKVSCLYITVCYKLEDHYYAYAQHNVLWNEKIDVPL